MTGTHTLQLEFSRRDSYEISTAMASTFEHINIEAEFVDEILIEQIRENFAPEDIFDEQVLIDWAVEYDRDRED